LPPPCEITFYLDAEGDDLTCRVEAAYGEEKYTILSRRDERAPWRDEERELQALFAAIRIFPSVDEEKRRFSVGRSEDAIYSILSSGLGELEALGRVMCTEAFSALRIRRKWNLQTGVRMDNGLLSLDIESADLTHEELLDVLLSYQQKKKYHRLKNGDFIDLTGETTETLYQLMLAAHASPKEFVSGKMHLPAYRALYLDTTLREHDEIVSSRDTAFRQLIRTFKTVNESDFEAPDSLQGVLRPYQTAGFQWLMTLSSAGFGGILADDMGLGKTLQMIAVLLASRESGRGQSLIVCPASLVYNWQAEFLRFAPQMDVRVISGNAQERKTLIEGSGDADVLVTSYDLLKRDLPLYEDITFRFEVLDEAQYIKNASAAAAKSVKIIRAQHRFALTGTPIENALSELWSIFDFLMPGFLYTYTDFRTAFETPIVKNGNAEASARLKKMVSPFILRRLKQDVLKDLPDKLEESRIVMMEEDQRRLYDGQVVKLRQFLENTDSEEFDKSRIRVLAELTRLRQLCCDPALTAEDYEGTSCKRAALMDLVREAISGGHKMLVFSQFTSMLDLIRGDLDQEGIAYDYLTGATPKARRLEMVNAFNQDGVPVFLISLKAGGTGLNLTGADLVIHVDPWWNAAAQNQATDRAHRIGQTRTVTVFKLICKNTIEEKIAEMQENKSALAEEILSGENGGFASLSRDDLMALISGDA
ncbi:MAG: DEAD/DEAH box helicase, partial [Clostridia bacterium]|nr:DEAD/DEAH box helicase [Clostridia bacterium]